MLVQEWSAFRRSQSASLVTGMSLGALGLLLWIALSVLGGIGAPGGFRVVEAWDTPAYFILALPLMALAVGAAAFTLPERFWRWPLCLVAGHQAGMLVVGLGMQSGLSLVILTLVLAALLATGFAVPALIGGFAGRRNAARPA